MLTKIIPILITTIIIFSIPSLADDTVILDINGTPPADWLMVRPGENATVSFNILLDKGQSSIDVPVPEIYTYFYPNVHTSYRLTTEPQTYKYLTCSAYKTNITPQTLTIPINITVLDDESTFYVEYTFAPPADKYNINTIFFIQNTEDISYIIPPEQGINWTLIGLLPLLALSAIPIHYFLVATPRREERRRNRERNREYQRQLERIAEMRSSLLETATEYQTPQPPPPPPPTTFKCRNKSTDVREFIKGDGLFDMGIKKFKVPSFDIQTRMIHELPEVQSFNPEALTATLNLNEYGRYNIEIRKQPKAQRIEPDGRTSHKNPYIHSGNFELCLGTGLTLYQNCYENKNYVECIRVICKILKSKHGGGYRKWSDCEV